MKNGRNGKQAILAISPDVTPDSAKVVASRMLTEVNVQDEIIRVESVLQQALIDEGITPTKIAEKVNVLLDANKKVYRNNMKTGKIELVGEEPNHDAIDKGLKHATNIFGVKTGEDPGMQRPNVVYNFFLNKDLKKKVEVVEGEIKQTLLENVTENKKTSPDVESQQERSQES